VVRPMSQAGRSCQGWDGRDGSGRVVEYPEAQMGILAKEWSGRRAVDGGPTAARARNEGILGRQPGRRQVRVLVEEKGARQDGEQ
jgi:hypothetical protein